MGQTPEEETLGRTVWPSNYIFWRAITGINFSVLPVRYRIRPEFVAAQARGHAAMRYEAAGVRRCCFRPSRPRPMRSLLRLALPLAFAAAPVAALAQASTDGPPRADTVAFRARGQRVEIVRAPGTDRQQRVEIRHGSDTLGVQLDVDPARIERWMRRIFVLDDARDADSATARPGDDSLGVPVRLRLRTRRAPARPVSDTTSALRPAAPLRDADGTVRAGRPGRLWVERLRDGERPGGDVPILRETERPGGDVPVWRDGETGPDKGRPKPFRGLIRTS